MLSVSMLQAPATLQAYRRGDQTAQPGYGTSPRGLWSRKTVTPLAPNAAASGELTFVPARMTQSPAPSSPVLSRRG